MERAARDNEVMRGCPLDGRDARVGPNGILLSLDAGSMLFHKLTTGFRVIFEFWLKEASRQATINPTESAMVTDPCAKELAAARTR
jgi:hypothetical protein